MTRHTRRTYAFVRCVLALAFLLRVVGQGLVVLFDAGFLPPLAQWDSDLVPYPVLLPVQALILAVQAANSRDIWRGADRFASARPRTARFLRSFSAGCFADLVARYVITKALHPERRWPGGAIPIVFHRALAANLLLLSRYSERAADASAGGDRARQGDSP